MNVSSFPLQRCLVAALLLPALACAGPVLPPADYYALVAAGSAANIFTSAGSYALGPASVEVFPAPSVSGRAEGNPAVGAGFTGGINYSFVIVGPNPDCADPDLCSRPPESV